MRKINNSFIIFMIIGLFAGLYSCDSSLEEKTEPSSEPTPVEASGEYASDMPKTLNVVYFVPKDMQASKTYHKRLSGVMLWMQDWYKQQLNRYGYSNKTFALLKDTKMPETYVKIIKIQGKYGKDYYPYSGGGQKAILEIKEYFAARPEDENSEHTIIFMPSTKGQHGNDAGGQPFYGIGRWCFALDYEFFDMKYWDTNRDEVQWIGGTIHELGHALNLPHNKELATEDWISMMADGNHYLYKTPEKVNFTAADAAILNNNQVFNPEGIDYYKTQSKFELKKMRIYADTDNLYLNAKFSSDLPVNALIAYNDPHVKDGDGDYNAITWTATDTKDGVVALKMPNCSLR